MKNKAKAIIALTAFLLVMSNAAAIDLTVTEPTDGEIYQSPIDIQGSTNESANISYAIDGGSYTTLENGVTSFSNTSTSISTGDHNITVKAIDASDSTDSTTKTVDFQIAETNYTGMQYLINFVGDLIPITLDLIPLVIVAIILSVVIYFGSAISDWLEGVTRKFD